MTTETARETPQGATQGLAQEVERGLKANAYMNSIGELSKQINSAHRQRVSSAFALSLVAGVALFYTWDASLFSKPQPLGETPKGKEYIEKHCLKPHAEIEGRRVNRQNYVPLVPPCLVNGFIEGSPDERLAVYGKVWEKVNPPAVAFPEEGLKKNFAAASRTWSEENGPNIVRRAELAVMPNSAPGDLWWRLAFVLGPLLVAGYRWGSVGEDIADKKDRIEQYQQERDRLLGLSGSAGGAPKP